MLEKICEELGVEIGEEWLGNDGYKYRITQNGEIFHYDKRGFYSGRRGFDRWASIFNGDLKPRWRPKEGEQYYIPDLFKYEYQRFDSYFWAGDAIDIWYFDNGLVFKTKEEAIECSNKMIELYKQYIKGD